MYKEKELKEGEEGIGMITLGYVRSVPIKPLDSFVGVMEH